MKNLWVSDSRIACKDCLEVKNCSEFPFQNRKDRPGYYLSRCIDCHKSWRSQSRTTRNSWVERAGKLNQRARKEGLACTLTANELEGLYVKQNGKCFYTGELMNVDYGAGLRPDSLSVDKIVCTGNYTADNVVLCTHRANTIKSNMSLDEFREWMPGWYAKLLDA